MAPQHVAEPSADSVEDLIAACLAGDDAAKAAFVGSFGGVVERAVVRKLCALSGQAPLRQEAEDLQHEVLARLLSDDCRMLAGLHKPKSLNAWLVSVSQNHVVDHLRKHTTRERAHRALAREPAGPRAASAEDLAVARERAEAVRAGIDALPPAECLLVQLFYLHGLRYAEIAEMTNLNINTVGTRLRRAKKRLEALLREDADPDARGIDYGCG